MSAEKAFPNGQQPSEIVKRSVESFVHQMRIFNEYRTVPRFECSFDLDDDINDLSHDQLFELIDDLREYADEVEAFLSENDLPSDMTISDIRDAEGKFVIDGEVYEDEIEWINTNFLDWGYHRFHGDINVIQCLTAFGGPEAGFWIHENGSISYYTCWYSPRTFHVLRGREHAVVREFLERNMECTSFEFECEHGVYNLDKDFGLIHGFKMLAMARHSANGTHCDDEDSE